MVRVTFILIAMLIGSSLRAIEFHMEASKRDFYQGENITVSFVLTGRNDSVDVEVAKFPEFRSFWSENTVLRQGPIPLLPIGNVFDPPSQILPNLTLDDLVRRYQNQRGNVDRKGVVGSYVITPMVGREDLKIEPMKVTVRDAFSNTSKGIFLLSQIPDLTIRRLPSPPSELAPLFKGAVGSFELEAENEDLPFRLGEPTVVRLVLRGEGNYPEINDLPFTPPKGVEFLSTRSQMLQTGQESSKLFEITLGVSQSETISLGTITLAYFNPHKNRYEKVSTKPIKLFYSPPTALVETSGKALLLPIEKAWHRSTNFLVSFKHLSLHLLLILLLGSHMVWVHLKKLNRRRHLGLSYIRKQRVKQIEETFKKGDAVMACLELTQFLNELVEKESDIPSTLSLSRSQKLQKLEAKWGRESRELIEKYLSEHDHSRFSQEKTPLSTPEIHLKKLSPILHKLSA